mmetsp:Transcript_8434/g.10993  ORF Transcript_8434/g.10993 Transcript_8434/m.10993 type:complete len:445 (+) Transcript_8434:88-1422(+)
MAARTLTCFSLLSIVFCAYYIAVRGDEATIVYGQEDIVKLVSDTEDEKSLLDFFRKNNLLKDQENACGGGIDDSIVAIILSKGYVDAAKEVAEACIEAGQKLDVSELQRKANALRRKLTDFNGYLQTANRAMSKVTPAFEWAQSKDQVFISVKFSHKLDTPACIDVVINKVDIKEDSISVEAMCKGKKKEFNLKLDLLKPIHIENSTWTMASVGRGTFTLSKQRQNTKWARLLKSRENKPKNMHVWWQLHEKYEAELNQAVKDEAERRIAEANAKTASETDGEGTTEVGKEDSATIDESDAKTDDESGQSSEELELQKARKKHVKMLKKEAKAEKKKAKKSKKETLKTIEGEIADLQSKIAEANKRKKDVNSEYDKRVNEVEKDLAEKIAKADKMTEEELLSFESPQEKVTYKNSLIGLPDLIEWIYSFDVFDFPSKVFGWKSK